MKRGAGRASEANKMDKAIETVVLVACLASALIPGAAAKKECVPYECLPICTKSKCDSQESTGHGTGSGGESTGTEGMGTDMGMSTAFARLLFMPVMPHPALMGNAVMLNNPAMMPKPAAFHKDAAAGTTARYHGAQQWRQPYYYFVMNPRNNFIRYKRSTKVDKIEVAKMAAKKVLEKLEAKQKKKEAKPSAKKIIKAWLQSG